MKSSEFITELFNQTAPYYWAEWATKEAGYMRAEFEVDELKYIVNFIDLDRKNSWEVNFSAKGNYDLTGTGNAFIVFSTVGKILKEWILKEHPRLFVFSADAKEPSRVKLYDKLSLIIRKETGYRLSLEKDEYATYYRFTK